MALLTLTPTQLPKTSAWLNLTTLIAAGTLGANTGVSFVNTGKEFLAVTMGGASTCSITVGTGIEGQTTPPLTPALPSSGTLVLGPFPTDEDVQPGALIQITFGTPASVTAALLQYVGVF
jgi:hypothetical protein